MRKEKHYPSPIVILRRIRWDSMHPEFNMAFAPDGPLVGLPVTYVTSFVLPEDRDDVLNAFTRRFPTVSSIEVDDVIAGIQQIITRVTQAIEAILPLVSAALLALFGRMQLRPVLRVSPMVL